MIARTDDMFRRMPPREWAKATKAAYISKRRNDYIVVTKT